MALNIKPLSDRVVVEPTQAEKQTTENKPSLAGETSHR